MKIVSHRRVLLLSAILIMPLVESAHSSEESEAERVLEEVVVVATRRQASMQDVPISVTALTRRQLSAAGISEIDGLGQAVPGLTGIRDSGGFRPIIRGVGSSGVVVGDEQNVATYVDGIYQGGSVFSWLDLVEIERVEVLRGPQGTVFGRNATGGLINVITPEPSFDPELRGNVQYGQLKGGVEDYEVKAYATGPLSGTVAANVAGMYRSNAAFVDNLVGDDDYGDQDAAVLRAKLLWQPTESLSVITTGEYIDIETQANVVQPYPGSLPAGATFPGAVVPTQPLQASLDTDPASDYERFNFSVRVKYDAAFATIESATAYSLVDLFQRSDSDATNILLGSNTFPGEVETFSQELRLLSKSSSDFEWLAGVYIFDLEAWMTLNIVTGDGSGVPTNMLVVDPDVGATSVAGFAEGTYRLADRWFMTLGARYTWEERKFSQFINGNQLPFGVARNDFKEPTYRAILKYELADAASAYLSYSTGFKSGVHNGIGTSDVPVRPETIKSLEFGVKAEPASWLRTNLAIFAYEYDDLQVTARSEDLRYVLQNAASVTGVGGELELSAAIGSDTDVYLTYSYLDSEYDEFNAAQSFIPRESGGNEVAAVDVSGNDVIRAPGWSMNAGWISRLDIGAGETSIGANIFRSDRLYFDAMNNFFQPAYTLVNLELSWTPDQAKSLRFYIAGRNLTDERVINFIRPSALTTDVVYDQPRRVSVGLELEF